jgi:hypothetical protein
MAGTKEWGRIFHGGTVRVSNIYMKGSSLAIIYNGSWHEVGDKALAIIKSMNFNWRNKVGDYRRYYYEFEVGNSRWLLDFDVVEFPGTAIQPKETTLKIRLDQICPHQMSFGVIYHPKVVNLNDVNLEDLLKSSLYRLPYVAEDLSRFADWIHIMNQNAIVIYHDRELTTRIDVVMGHKHLPYRFVIAYHIDKPYFSTDLHIVADAKSYYDTLAEAIMDEYWPVIVGGGEKR